jgi:hypothetical protein
MGENYTIAPPRTSARGMGHTLAERHRDDAMFSVTTIPTQIFSRLPDALRRDGIDTSWTRARGSGPLHSFLEGPAFDRARPCVTSRTAASFASPRTVAGGVRRVRRQSQRSDPSRRAHSSPITSTAGVRSRHRRTVLAEVATRPVSRRQ